jgi:membrane protease YdiL (CAAX protease family)
MSEKNEAHGTQPVVNSTLDEGLVPSVWSDLLIYLIGGVGLYFLAGIGIGYFIQEVNLQAALLISVSNFLVLGGSLYLFGVRRNKLSWKSIGLFPPKDLGRQAMIGVALAVGILPLRMIGGAIGLLIEQVINGEIFSLTMRENLFSVGMDTWYGVLVMLLGIGILAPIGEELFFRGLLFDFFKKKLGLNWGIALSSLAFGLAHFDSLAVVLSSLIMGVVMAIAVERTRSIWISIFMHIVTNSGAVLMLAVSLQLEKLIETSFF